MVWQLWQSQGVQKSHQSHEKPTENNESHQKPRKANESQPQPPKANQSNWNPPEATKSQQKPPKPNESQPKVTINHAKKNTTKAYKSRQKSPRANRNPTKPWNKSLKHQTKRRLKKVLVPRPKPGFVLSVYCSTRWLDHPTDQHSFSRIAQTLRPTNSQSLRHLIGHVGPPDMGLKGIFTLWSQRIDRLRLGLEWLVRKHSGIDHSYPNNVAWTEFLKRLSKETNCFFLVPCIRYWHLQTKINKMFWDQGVGWKMVSDSMLACCCKEPSSFGNSD